MLSTESELEEVEESDQQRRVLSTESPSIKVSINLSQLDHTELLLKIELERDAETSEFSTLTGLDKTEPSNSSKSSSLTHHTRLLQETPESAGLQPINISTEKTEDSHPLAKSTEDLE